MKILSRICIAIAVLIALPLIIALFVKKEYAVENQIIVNKPKQEVFNYVKLLKNQENYNIWLRKDPNVKKDLRGTDGTIGFVFAWDGNDEIGKGEQEIKTLNEGEKIETELRFIEPFEGIASASMITEAVSENQTRVRWTMSGESKYPMNLTNLFVDGMLKKDLQTSLNDLKNNLEKN